MAQVTAQPTPNPQAYKFTIGGHTFPGPSTVSRDSATGTPFAPLFEIAGVASVFATANFVTVTKDPDADWGTIVDRAKEVLEGAF